MSIRYQDLSYYEKNFHLLKKSLPKIAHLIEPKLYNSIEIIKTKTNSASLTYNNILLHSKYNPHKEGLNFPIANHVREGDIILLYGFGLGYHLIPLLETIKDKGRLYVIELNLEILATAFSILDLTPLLGYKNFQLISGIEQMEVVYEIDKLTSTVLKDYPPRKKKVLLHAPSFKCLPKKFSKIKNALELLLVGKESTFVFKDIMKKNLKINLDFVLKNPGIKTLYGKLNGKPSLFIGAGPSLDRALPYIKSYQEKAFIVCVDTAFPVLTDYGIAVDFIVTVDPQEDSFRHFDRHLSSRNGVLICTPTACSQVIEKYQGPKLVVIKKDQALLASVETDLMNKGITIGGGSVSCIGLDILINFKVNPIIFIGMDFSFPYMKAYSSNAADTKQLLTRLNKFNTLEMLHRQIIKKKKLVFLQNKEGTEIPTHQNLYSYVKNIEQIVKLNPQTKYLNFMSCGVDIKGLDNLYFTEELAQQLTKKINKKISLPVSLPLDTNLKEKIIATVFFNSL